MSDSNNSSNCKRNMKTEIIHVCDWLAIKIKNYEFRNTTPKSVGHVSVLLVQERNGCNVGLI